MFIVSKRLVMDLLSSSCNDTVYAVRGDAYTRAVELELRKGRKPWPIPDGVSVAVEYKKPDGTKGFYDTLPDGTQAWSIEENILTIQLAPQMLTSTGTVVVQIRITKNNSVLSLFKFHVFVHQKITGTESEDYLNWRSAFIPQVIDAEVGQYIEIAEVDSEGRAVKVRAVNAPHGGGSLDTSIEGETLIFSARSFATIENETLIL